MPENRKAQGGLQRKTPLRSTKPLTRGAGLNPGKGLKQGSGLKRSAPLSSGNGLKRTPMKQKAPMGKGEGEAMKRKPIRRTQMKSKPPEVTPEERQCRALVAERSQGLCECCGRSGALEKAHRVARSQGGKWDASNILDLCHKCHQEDHHANPAEAYEGGWHLRSTSDPRTSPVLLWKGGRYDWALLDDEGGWNWCDAPADS